jgi:nitroreductase
VETISDTLIHALQSRYATKRFDPSFSISQENLHLLKESIRLAPSAFGLQLWKVFLIRTPEFRKKMTEAAHNQPQFMEASELFLFCRPEKITEDLIDQFVTSVSKIRNQPKSTLVAYRQMLSGLIHNIESSEQGTWMEKQIYIALGSLLQSAALLQLDACPIEGFNHNAVDSFLGLPEKGYRSVVACAMGKRSPEDAYASAAKVRYSEEVVFGIL